MEKLKERNRQVFQVSHDALKDKKSISADLKEEISCGKKVIRRLGKNNGPEEKVSTDDFEITGQEHTKDSRPSKIRGGHFNAQIENEKGHTVKKLAYMSDESLEDGIDEEISIEGGYDYHLTDSDNDGMADVSDVYDYNPDNQDFGDIHNRASVKMKDQGRLKKQKNFNKRKTVDEANEMKSKTNPKTHREQGEEKTIKKKSKMSFEEKQPKSKFLQNSGRAVIAVGVAGMGAIERYSHVERLSDSDENSALQAADVGSDVLKRVTDKNKQRLNQGLRNRSKKVSSEKLEQKYMKLKHNSKFEATLRNNKIYQNSSGMNKYYQKIRMKKVYNQRIYGTYNNRIQRIIKGSGKKLKEVAMVAFKRIGIYLAIIIFALLLGIIFISSFAGMISNAMSVIAITSYQSDDLGITDSENFYNRFEADLLYAIKNVEVEHSEYDEYRYHVDDVGHNPHEIIAYLTAKFGEFTVSEVRNELSRIFDEQYLYRLTKVVETRYKTVTSTSTDPVTGETTTTTKKVSYKWNILKIDLETNSLESILLSKLDDEQKELYITLMETKGNFQSLPSPIKEDWKNSVSSMFGYRLDPFTDEVEFHTGIDIAKPLGTKLVAIIDGIVLDTGYDNSYGKYIILKNDEGQTALYAHCNNTYVSKGTEIYIGEVIGEVGSTGNSTGSHLHLEIRDSNGNRLNPYFYLSNALEF